MIAAEEKPITGAAANRPHAAAVRIDARGAAIVEAAAVHRAPEGRIELEVRAAPLPPHRPEHVLEMRPGAAMRPVDGLPRPAPPAAERPALRSQRLAVRSC